MAARIVANGLFTPFWGALKIFILLLVARRPINVLEVIDRRKLVEVDVWHLKEQGESLSCVKGYFHIEFCD